DGRLGHEGEWLFVDRRRDRRVAASGRVTMRAGWVDVEADACELAVDILCALAVRGYRGGSTACGPTCPAAKAVAS
ncbi:MAG: hypothetical protein ACRCY8_02085, partial [Dermatophilaceae bacterium]